MSARGLGHGKGRELFQDQLMADKDVLTGEHFIHGDAACAEGGLAAGCRFFAGYPITPATEVAERMARRLPEVGGIYIQMEDEIASMAAILGASWGGVKSMTSTSGPGFSLMMENVGLGMMTLFQVILGTQVRGRLEDISAAYPLASDLEWLSRVGAGMDAHLIVGVLTALFAFFVAYGLIRLSDKSAVLVKQAV